MLSKLIIRESFSPCCHRRFSYQKLLDGKPKYRFCVEFRALNAVTKLDPYPLPNMNETTSNIFGSKYFSVLDCYIVFWQVKIKEEHKEAFTVPSGHFDFNRLQFGLSNSPANIQPLIDIVLRNFMGVKCLVYIDDVIIFQDLRRTCR